MPSPPVKGSQPARLELVHQSLVLLLMLLLMQLQQLVLHCLARPHLQFQLMLLSLQFHLPRLHLPRLHLLRLHLPGLHLPMPRLHL